MNKIGSFFVVLLGILAAVLITILTFKLARRRHPGVAEKAGNVIDASIRAAADKLEKAADAIEEFGENGLGKNIGKGLDEILSDAKKTLEKAADSIQAALKNA
jgi:hypothetical protein